MTKREIDEAGFQAARAHAEAIGWLPDDGSAEDRQDGYRQLREILSAYLGALPEPKPARDRIAVVVDANGYAVGWSDLHSWTALEDLAVDEGSVRPLRRVVVGCDLGRPVPVEPVEVDGTVEEVGP